jgi:HEPN domain-containing protein
MPRSSVESGSPADWLRFARSDLELAKGGRFPGVVLEALCFHAQQAAEKALKAILVHHGISFPKTHQLRDVLDLLPEGIPVPRAVENATILTRYAVAGRYPFKSIAVSEPEYRKAVRMAAVVVRWVERLLYA